MSLDFDKIVKSVLLEADTNSTLLAQIQQSFGNQGDIKSVADIASRLSLGGQQYIRNSQLNTMKPIWPYIDIMYVLSSYLPNKKEIVNLANVDKDVATFLADNGYDPNSSQFQVAQKNILTKIQNLKNTTVYVYTADRLKTLNNVANEVATINYRSLTPLQAVLAITQKVGGYDEKKITEIMQQPVKYDLPTSIELPELEPIRNISHAIYAFYLEFFRENLQAIKQVLPDDLKNLPDNRLFAVIEGSIGRPNPQNTALQQDYVKFVNGNSEYLFREVEEPQPPPLPPGVGQQSTAAESFTNLVSEIIGSNTATNISQQYSNPATVTQNPTPTNQQQQQQIKQEPKKNLVKTPVIKSVHDFSDTGYATGIGVWDTFVTFVNSIKAGSLPSKWQLAGKGLGMLGKAVRGLSDLASGFKGF